MQRSELNLRAPGTAGTPSQSTQACLKLGDLEGLRQIVVGADIEARDATLERVVSREDEDRGLDAALPYGSDQLDAAEAGQTEIDDGDVIRLGLQRQHTV